MILKSKSRPVGLAAWCVLAALPLLAQAADVRVARDAETGTLRALTPAENAALTATAKTAAIAATASGPKGLLTGQTSPKEVKHADGSASLELTEEHLMMSVVRRNEDGTMSYYCTDASHEHAAHAGKLGKGKILGRKASKEAGYAFQ